MPVPHAEDFRLAPHVDMGPGRWDPVGGESVFALRDAQRLAELPQHLAPGQAERMARARSHHASVELPSVFGRKITVPTGRALFWGTLLGVAGASALLVATMRAAGVGSAGRLAAAREEA